MPFASVDAEVLLQLKDRLAEEMRLLESLSVSLSSTYDGMRGTWNDDKYARLGQIVAECVDECKSSTKHMAEVQSLLDRLIGRVREYDSVNIAGSTASQGSSSSTTPVNQILAQGASPSSPTQVNTIDSISTWIKDINPDFNNPFTPKARVNCGSCAFAVESRLNGNQSAIASLTNIGTDEEMEQATGRSCVYMRPGEIVSRLVQMGPGSHLIAGINRRMPNGQPIAGHWFNLFYDGEHVYTIDGQSGEVLGFPYNYGYISEWCALV